MLPWGQIFTTSLTLADLAHSLYKKTRNKSKTNDQPEATIVERVEALELLQREQANLLQMITEQNNNLVRKVRKAYTIAIVSPIVSIAILLLYMLQ